MFDLFNNFILADGSDNLFTVITASISAVGVFLSGIISYFMTKPKNKDGQSEQFVTLMEQSSEFREEIRKDRDIMKIDLAKANGEIEELRRHLSECQIQMSECHRKLSECQEYTDEVLQQIRRHNSNN